jgi:single-strand DNA-binding protein
MSNSKNSVLLVGYLGNAPEVKTLTNNRKVARASVATNDFYHNGKGEKIEETNWHSLIMWGKTAEIAEASLQKGSLVSIEGRLVSRSYLDKAGAKRYITEVVVNELALVEKAAIAE